MWRTFIRSRVKEAEMYAVLNQCDSRIIDLGYDSVPAESGHFSADRLDSDTLMQMAKLNIALAWSIYPVRSS